MASILLNGVVGPEQGARATIGDHDRDGIPDLAVKFSRWALHGLLSPGDGMTVSVSALISGECFSGTGEIRLKRSASRWPRRWPDRR